MEKFSELEIGATFQLPSSAVIDYIKLGPLAYGSLMPNPAVTPLRLHGRDVYEIYKTSVANKDRPVKRIAE